MRRLAIIDALLVVVLCVWLQAAAGAVSPLLDRELGASKIIWGNSCWPPPPGGSACNPSGNGCPGLGGIATCASTTGKTCQSGGVFCTADETTCAGKDWTGAPCYCNPFSC